jgi:hypothetical protein
MEEFATRVLWTVHASPYFRYTLFRRFLEHVIHNRVKTQDIAPLLDYRNLGRHVEGGGEWQYRVIGNFYSQTFKDSKGGAISGDDCSNM